MYHDLKNVSYLINTVELKQLANQSVHKWGRQHSQKKVCDTFNNALQQKETDEYQPLSFLYSVAAVRH